MGGRGSCQKSIWYSEIEVSIGRILKKAKVVEEEEEKKEKNLLFMAFREKGKSKFFGFRTQRTKTEYVFFWSKFETSSVQTDLLLNALHLHWADEKGVGVHGINCS